MVLEDVSFGVIQCGNLEVGKWAFLQHIMKIPHLLGCEGFDRMDCLQGAGDNRLY